MLASADPTAPADRPPPLEISLLLATIADVETGALDPGRVVEAARRAEDGGFDAVYVGDHVAHPRPMLDSTVTLATVAAATDRIALGPCVYLLALRPLPLAVNELGTLARFAPGRLRVGVGVGGEYPSEYEAVGVPFAERGARTSAAIGPLREHLGDVPIFLGGSSDAALRRAGERGDGWVGYLLGVESFARRRDRLAVLRRECGREHERFSLGMLLPILVTTSDDARADAAQRWSRMTAVAAALPERLFIAGSVEDVVAQLDEYRCAGCTELVLTPADHGAGYLEQVDVLVGEVLPRLRAIDDEDSGGAGSRPVTTRRGPDRHVDQH